MKKIINIALGFGFIAGLGSSADAAVKYVGSRNGPGPNCTSEFNIATQDGGALDDGPGGDGEVYWANTNTYVLEDVVMVTNGTLRIQEGSIVRGQPQSANGTYDPGALVITRTAKLIAVGNASQPIIFTTAAVSNTQYGAVASGGAPTFWDLNPTNRGLYDGPSGARSSGRWGGVVLLGNAPTNVDRTPLRPTDAIGSLDRTKIRIAGESGGSTPVPAPGTWVNESDDRPSIEGIPTDSEGFTNGFDRYGGHDSSHSSGDLQFVSIKFGGAEVNANNELNGLTLGGVGSGTVIDRVEIFGNTDDGIEIFGGTANLKRVVVVGVEDDQLDIDVGFQGTIQFALAITAQDSDKMCEWDGSYEGESPNGFTAAENGSGNPGAVNNARASNDGYGVYNATFIGNLAATTGITNDTTAEATGNNDRNHGIQIRDQSSPSLVNSVLVNPRGYGLALGNRNSVAVPINENDVTNRFASGYAKLSNVTFAKAGATSATLAAWADNNNVAVAQAIIDNAIGTCVGNEVIDDAVMLNLPTASGHQFLPNNLKINPVAYGASAGATIGGGAVEPAQYRGAFNPFEPSADLWTRGWSCVSNLGIVVETGLEGY